MENHRKVKLSRDKYPAILRMFCSKIQKSYLLSVQTSQFRLLYLVMSLIEEFSLYEFCCISKGVHDKPPVIRFPDPPRSSYSYKWKTLNNIVNIIIFKKCEFLYDCKVGNVFDSQKGRTIHILTFRTTVVIFVLTELTTAPDIIFKYILV